MQDQLKPLRDIAVAAGREILDVYDGIGFLDISLKDNSTPLTQADTRANTLIIEQLAALNAAVPILSEEINRPDWNTRQSWHRYWLVDPLDGTREFLDRNGEFTVNIALIEAGEPVLGVVHAPVPGLTYYGGLAVGGAWKQSATEPTVPLEVSAVDPEATSLRLLASRSHRSEKDERLIALARSRFPQIDLQCRGSSLKLCLVAEGSADLYVRLGPTSEWDTAAAHAVLRAAGGELFTTDFKSLRYNQKEDVLNPDFLVIGDTGFDWQVLLAPALE